MRPAVIVLASFAGLAALPGDGLAATVQRFALVVGANQGGSDRPVLQYAVSDAERFSRVLVELGGVSSSSAILLKQPSLRQLEAALDDLRARVTEGQRAAGEGGRTEVLLYYSGHADEKGLLLGEDRYSYRSLRDRLDEVPADVRIAVLDACSSGAITRLKGGRLQQPFLVDESARHAGARVPDLERAPTRPRRSRSAQGLVLHPRARHRAARRRPTSAATARSRSTRPTSSPSARRSRRTESTQGGAAAPDLRHQARRGPATSS